MSQGSCELADEIARTVIERSWAIEGKEVSKARVATSPETAFEAAVVAQPCTPTWTLYVGRLPLLEPLPLR